MCADSLGDRLLRYPITGSGGCALVASGATRRARASVTTRPTVCSRMGGLHLQSGAPQYPPGRIAPYRMQPNTDAQPLPEAEARYEQRLEVVRCSAWLAVAFSGIPRRMLRLPRRRSSVLRQV